MKSKNLIILIVILIIAIAAVVGFFIYKNLFSNRWDVRPSITIQDEQITDDTKPFIIKIVYPQIVGLDDFNQKAKTTVDKEINDFKVNSLANDAAVKEIDPVNYAKYPREYELDIDYDKGQIDNDVVSVVFNVYNFEGGAHGASYFIPLNYDVKLKKEIALADLFLADAGLLQKISDYCIKDLTKQITEKLGSTEGTWIQDGAGPKEENFQFFLINKNNIVFYFPQYQIAYGAAGDFRVVMPR